MRNSNLFGKKIRRVNIVFILVFILIIELSGYLFLSYLQQNKIDQLKEDQADIQLAINQALDQSSEEEYLQISEMVDHLPTTISAFLISEELELLRNLTGISLDSNFNLEISMNVTNPFHHTFASTFRSVSIDVTMDVDDSSLLFDFLDNLDSMERIYYVEDVKVVLYTDGSARAELTLFTFYNAITN